MDKADFIGRLKLIDDFTTFDNDRFSEIMQNSDMIEPVTQHELEYMNNIHAIIVDREWFQIYDNNNKFTEDYVAAGMYWNYFYNVWKTVSYSPFSNIVAFTSRTDTFIPVSVSTTVTNVEIGEKSNIITLVCNTDGVPTQHFEQTEVLTAKGVAVHPYGAYIVPNSLVDETLDINMTYTNMGKTYTYTGKMPINPIVEAGTVITLNKV